MECEGTLRRLCSPLTGVSQAEVHTMQHTADAWLAPGRRLALGQGPTATAACGSSSYQLPGLLFPSPAFPVQHPTLQLDPVILVCA